MNIKAILTPHNRDVRVGRAIRYLVFHYTGTLAPAVNNAVYYGSKYIGASAHYYLDAGDIIYQGVEDKDVAWHCGGVTVYRHPECRNANSIGIEMVPRKANASHLSAADTDWSFDPKTLVNAVALGRALMAEYGIPIERVLRHYDVTGKLCPNPFCVDAKAGAAWEEFKRRLVADEGAGAISSLPGHPSEEGNLSEGEIDMTKEEVLKLVQDAVAASRKVYADLGDVPEWGRPTVQRLIEAGALHGDEAGRLNLTEDLLRALVIMERGGASETRAKGVAL